VNDIWVKLVGSAEQGIYAWNGSAWVLGSDITGLFTAAAITGQGALATLNQATWATQVTGTGKPDDFANKVLVTQSSSAPGTPGVNDIWVKIVAGVYQGVYAWNGSAWVLGSDITGLFTAAAIAGQGALATLNVVGAVQLAASQGTNAIVDAGFRFLSAYWTNVTSAPGAGPAARAPRATCGTSSARPTGTPGAGVNNSMGQGFHAGLLPCRPGDRIEASAYLAGSGVASANVIVEWFNSAGTFLGNTSVASLSGNPAGSSFSGGHRRPDAAGRASPRRRAARSTPSCWWSGHHGRGGALHAGGAAADPPGQLRPDRYHALVARRRGAAGRGRHQRRTRRRHQRPGQLRDRQHLHPVQRPRGGGAGSIWVDTSGAYAIVKQRISGAWVTIANNASPPPASRSR
jgi:hypothetical protein